MTNKIQIRRDTTVNWDYVNPILSQGEFGLDITTKQFKIGDGSSTWSALSVYTGNSNSLVNGLHTISLNSSGSVSVPTLNVDLHNGGIQSAQVLQFNDSTKQVVITGPTPNVDNDAQRIIIQGQRGTGTGEGGDVYIWGGDSAANGGDIKIYAGDGEASPSNGGYVNIDGGSGYAYGGNVEITGGYASQFGGNVILSAGNAGGQDGVSGHVTINASNHSWTFGNDGKLTLPVGGDIVNNTGNSITDIYKFAYGIIGTKDNPDTGTGWGGYNMYLDPGGESWASIFIPSVSGQDGGAALQITNKGAANSIVQVFGRGGVQLVTNTGADEKLFEFGDNGNLTLPGAAYINTSPNYIHANYGILLHPTHNTGGTGPELYISYNDGIVIQPITNDYFQSGTAAAPLFIIGSELPNNSDSIGKLPGDVYIEGGRNYQDNNYGNVFVKSGTNQWKFNPSGQLTFPDTTIQSTAYQKVAVPAHSYGVTGDKAGMVAFDADYMYYCTADYVDNTTNIWKRTSHGSGTW